MFGFKKERMENGYTSVGEIEKVIVDGLFLPRYCPISETFGAMEGIDTAKLIRYGKKMSSIVTLKRMGYLLSLYGIDVYDELRDRLNNRYDLLNPSLPPSGEKDRKWRLKVNEAIKTEEVIPIYKDVPPYLLVVMNLSEIMAEKIRAIYTRD